jgi:glycosyltransferase involved in cell wall biosynthesis
VALSKMKILQILDTKKWAIGHLADSIVKYNPHFKWKVLEVHPREVEQHIEEVRALLDWPDVIQFEYWNTARQLLEAIPELKQKKCILTHHNQKDLLAADWSCMRRIVCHTNKSVQVLMSDGNYENVDLIPYGFNLEYFKFNPNYTEELSVGYCGRIVPWKGLKEIARACYELGYPLKIMGKMDKVSYWDEIPLEHKENMDLSFMNAEDDDRRDFYYNIGVYVGYSADGREEGTMPFQEAMACGAPILTTPSGVAADILIDSNNAVITPFEDYEALKANLKMLMEDRKLREFLREEAWHTIKNYTDERMAKSYEKVIYKANSDQTLVSVIIATTPNRIIETEKILESLQKQDYKNIEAVVVFDQKEGRDERSLICQSRFYIQTKSGDIIWV